jgi:hypothetical protein
MTSPENEFNLEAVRRLQDVLRAASHNVQRATQPQSQQPQSQPHTARGVDRANDDFGLLLKRMSAAPVQELDRMIAELQSFRDLLRREGARLYQEIAEFSTMNQAAAQSTRIVADSLARVQAERSAG